MKRKKMSKLGNCVFSLNGEDFEHCAKEQKQKNLK